MKKPFKMISKGLEGMKKIICVFAAVLMIFSCVAHAEENLSNKPITFMNFEFGDTFKNIRNQTRIFCIDFMYGNICSRAVADALYDFGERDEFIGNRKIPSCFFARTSETFKVAGYDVGTTLWFVYPFKDGIFMPDEDQAVFYAGCYEFHSWDDLPNVHTDIKSKMTVIYGEPYLTGSSITEAMGEMPLKDNLMDGYNDDNAKFKPEYSLWKSEVNDAYAVLSFWYDTNLNEYRLKLTYVSDIADPHFDQMAALGVFGEDYTTEVNDDLGGL